MFFFRGIFRRLLKGRLWRDHKRVLLVFLLFSVLVAAYMVVFEKLSLIDSYYFLVTTATTVGYGDFSPQTTFGKFLITLYMLIGISIIGLFLGKVTDLVLALNSQRRRGLKAMDSNVDLIIAGYPGERKVRHLVAELRSDHRYAEKVVVCVTNRLQEKPEWMGELEIEFIHGVASDSDVLRRAGVDSASTVLMLARDPEQIESDDFSVAVCLVVEQLNSNARTILERVRQDDLIFNIIKADTVVEVSSPAVLAQEILDPGAIELQNAIFSNATAGTQFNLVFEGQGVVWRELAGAMLSQHSIPEGFRNPGESTFNLLPSATAMVEKGALVKYRSDHPLAWGELVISR